MSMTGKERLIWLKQIKRIHNNQNKKDLDEFYEHLRIINEQRNSESEY